MEAETITFKIYFEDTDIRRITLNVCDWYEFTRQLKELYPNTYHQELRLQYVDEEGDKITVSSEMEFKTMLQFHRGCTGPLKLFVTEGSLAGKYFKDGPAEQIVKVYEEEGGEQPSEELLKLCSAVPEALKPLFPDGKILPYNLPPWLSKCFTVKKVCGAIPTVDVDINIPDLFDALHKRALALMDELENSKALEEARTLLLVQLSLVPNHFLALYNLACAESLLGNVEAGVAALASAVEHGYKNLQHMQKDADLDNLRDSEGYKEVEKILMPEEAVTMDEEPVEPEEPLIEEKEQDESMEVADETPEREEPIIAKMEEEEPVVVKILSKWQTQLDSLAAMGFTDTEACEKLLNKHKGDVVRVVHSLLA